MGLNVAEQRNRVGFSEHNEWRMDNVVLGATSDGMHSVEEKQWLSERGRKAKKKDDMTS